MGGPPLVVRLNASKPSKVILGPKKQRPASQNVERVKVDQLLLNGRFENVEAGGYFSGGDRAGQEGRHCLVMQQQSRQGR